MTIIDRVRDFFQAPTSRSCIVLIAVCTFVVYATSLSNGFLLIDDDKFIALNPLVSGRMTVFDAFVPSSHADLLLYIPLTIVTWKMTWLVGGGSAVAFHFVDLLLHIANAVLIFWILDRVVQRRLLALFAALIFALHPLNAEAVLWATQRKDLLSEFFALASFALYMRHKEEGKDTMPWLSVIAFALGLVAKVGIFPLPIALLLYDFVLDREIRLKALLEKLPYVVLSVPFVLIGLSSGSQFLAPLGLGTMILLGAKSTATLFLLFLAPILQSPLRWEAGPVFSSGIFLVSFALCIGLAMSVVLLFLRNTRKSMSTAFGILWFFLFLAPTFPSAIKAGVLYYTAEKYAYLPMLGLLLALVMIIAAMKDRWLSVKKFLLPVGVVILLALGGRTFAYSSAWRDTETLSRYVIAHDETHPVALGTLGAIAERAGNLGDALGYYKRALASDPTNATAYINLASVAMQQGRGEDMLKIFRQMVPMLTERQMRGDPFVRGLLLSITEDVIAPRDRALAEEMTRRVEELAPEEGNER